MAEKRVLRYLKGSKDLELCYTKDAGGIKLYGSADADGLEMMEGQLLAIASFQAGMGSK